MSTMGTVVVLHAHPDDEAIFTGATIRRAVDSGARVVLVTATSGEAGDPRIALPAGETLWQRRIVELERACAVLGVARLVLLGYRDSGAHAGPYAPRTLGAVPAGDAARHVERVVRAESASALVHYDGGGIYGHVDHVQVHRIGAQVVARTGITGYEATVDREALRAGPYHVVQSAAGAAEVGVEPREVSLTIEADATELLAKMAAMSAHASQIGPRWLEPRKFAEGYAREWFVRRGGPGLLDSLATTSGGTDPAGPWTGPPRPPGRDAPRTVGAAPAGQPLRAASLAELT
jgi:LmbE family N-acetylglucosaminyl deacetylase